MASPDVAMAREARFLDPWGRVNPFGFHMGRLALYYPQRGRVGVMLLESRAMQ